MSEGTVQRPFNPATLRLIAITDSLRDGIAGLAGRAAAGVAGGATMLQLRLAEDNAHALVEIARALLAAAPTVPLIVNGRADVALAAGAHGVHLGVDDLSAAVLRRVLPAGFIIGASVGDARDASRVEGADYVAIGPVFQTASRTEGGAAMGLSRFAELAALCALPSVAVGGITEENAAATMRSGAAGIAVISALFSSSDPRAAACALRLAQDASGR